MTEIKTYYHYTNIAAFLEIVRTRQVWFSSLAFMNDAMEGLELHRVLSEVLAEHSNKSEFESSLKLIESTARTYLRDQFVFSASALKDDISQWRAYTETGHGVSLGFTDGFIQHSSVRKVDCIYSHQDKREAISNNKYLSANDPTMNNLIKEQQGLEEYSEEISLLLSIFKHSSFEPEAETRWVHSAKDAGYPKSTVQYRPHRFGLTPYKPLTVNLNYLTSVTLGPQVLKPNLEIIEDFLFSESCNARPRMSDVTLR